VERRDNPKQFHSHQAGVYFAFVSMSTFGFGDITPVTRTGRLMTIAWTMTSVLSLAAFTSVVSARLTVSQLGLYTLDRLSQVRPSDVCVEEAYPLAQKLVSDSFGLDGDLHSAGVMLSSSQGCAQAVMDGTVLVYVSDQPLLNWLAYSFYKANTLYVSPVVRGNPFSFAYPAGSPLRSVIDAAIIQFTTNTTWVAAAQNLQAIWFPVQAAQAPTPANSISKPTFVAAVVLLGVSFMGEVGHWAHKALRQWRARPRGSAAAADDKPPSAGSGDGGAGADVGAATALREAERAQRAAADAVAAAQLAAEAAGAAAAAAAALACAGVSKQSTEGEQPAAGVAACCAPSDGPGLLVDTPPAKRTQAGRLRVCSGRCYPGGNPGAGGCSTGSPAPGGGCSLAPQPGVSAQASGHWRHWRDGPSWRLCTIFHRVWVCTG
jgi:hypothetical protein